jgi:hypothetical protein
MINSTWPLFSALLLWMVVTSSCGHEDGVSDDVIDEQGIWTDPQSGLSWVNSSDNLPLMQQENAENYCATLVLGGYEDWRLPTIDELRTLVRGCPGTQPDGTCNIGEDDCLIWSCRDDSCDGCSPGYFSSGACYWPKVMFGQCSLYVSSSLAQGDRSYGEAWTLEFSAAWVDRQWNKFVGFVRCVRRNR